MKSFARYTVLLAAVGGITTALPDPSALAQQTPALSEVVPTARQQPAEWRYTFDNPGDGWTSPSFDDAAWKSGRGGFGSDGTPGIPVNTPWSTQDIWLRRTVQLPSTGVDPASTQLLVFHDEDVEIYLDGQLAARRNGFVRDYEPVDLAPTTRALLKPGATIHVAVHCHQTSGGQGVDVGFANVPPEILAARHKDHLRDFAMSNSGDPANGRRLFADTLSCVRCHTTDGHASLAGPDLSTVGDKFTRHELIDAVLNPSANIAVGYSTTAVTTTDGDTYLGVIKDASDQSLGLMDGDGKLHTIPLSDIRTRRTLRDSMMPEGLGANLTLPQFADLIAYLQSLRLPAMAGAARQGMPANIPSLSQPVSLVPIHRPENRFNHPCWLGQLPGDPTTFLICEHETGRIWRLSTAPGAEAKSLWADFRREVRPGGATGLLGLAFHPHFRDNRKYYIQHQIAIDGRIYARVSEKIASPDLTQDSGQPSRTIIEFPCSTDVHSGGGIAFGPDGFLYVGMGDTGPQGDPEGHAQNLSLPLGKMLRIDVDHQDNGHPYAIPADNPFRSQQNVRPEIYAYGFREPWRFSFDPATGDLWVGDVGQDRIEEVDLVHRGENYGWNVYEGFDLFSTRRRSEGANYTPPVFAYDRHYGNSITGGYVYRGDPTSPFNGLFICGDFTSRRVWALKQSDRKLTAIWQICSSPEPIASFARDDAGNLYIVGYDGTMFRLDLAHASSPELAK